MVARWNCAVPREVADVEILHSCACGFSDMYRGNRNLCPDRSPVGPRCVFLAAGSIRLYGNQAVRWVRTHCAFGDVLFTASARDGGADLRRDVFSRVSATADIAIWRARHIAWIWAVCVSKFRAA